MKLRPLKCSDAPQLYHASFDNDVRYYMPGCYCTTIKQAEQYIKKMLSYSDVQVSVITTDENSFVGIVILSDQGYKGGRQCFEISYFIDKNFRRKGYATSAVRYILEQNKSCRIYFSIESSNIASLSIAYKFNAIREDAYYYYIET